jgi:hypothetical protein
LHLFDAFIHDLPLSVGAKALFITFTSEAVSQHFHSILLENLRKRAGSYEITLEKLMS